MKDSDDNIKFWPDGTLTYRQRKLYNHVPELSVQDPDKTFITVPNIPYWTGMHKAMKKGFGKGVATSLVGNVQFIFSTLNTVPNLHFLSKKSSLISRENCRFFLGEKLVKML